MGRRRSQNKHLPALVSVEFGSYYFRRGKEPRINLGRDFAEAMRRYGELLGPSPLSKFSEVIDRYQREITPRKAERTQEDELRYLGALRAVFGAMAPRDITPVMIAQLRDKLAVKHGDVQANHHLKTLKHLLRVATEWGAISHNPAREVSKLKVKPRERYVTDDELAAVRAKAHPMVQVAIDLAVLTGLRRGDLLSLTKDHLKEDGIHVTTAKTGRGLIIEYTPELTAVLERAKLMKPHFRKPLIANRQGKAFTGSGFATLWRRALVKVYPKGREAERYTFNDLRAKSASDTAELADASARLGHSTTAVTKRHYVRKPTKVKPLR